MLARKKPRVSLRSTDSRASEVFNLSVQLQCARTDLTEKRDIKLESPPHTYTQNILAVKKQVEKQFSIPVCVQTLSYHGHVVKNGIKLSDLRVRNGDIFHVDYLAEGDCTDIMEIISWLEQLSIAISCRSPGVGLNDTVAFGIQRELLEDLEAFFSPWEDPTSRSYVNKLLFADNDGIGMIMKIYGFLLQMSWNKMDENLKNFEENITRSLECFTETVPLCRLLIQHNIIQMATRSLLQVKLKEDKGIYDLDTSGDQYQQSCLAETVYASIGILSNLVELPEARLEIATNKRYSVTWASTPEAHQYITDAIYVRRLLQACDEFSLDPKQPLLEYYTLLTVIQVSLVSPHCLESDQVHTITKKIESFLIDNCFAKIRDKDICSEKTCSTFIPYLKLVYIPNVPQAEGTPVYALQLVSLQLAIFSLQNCLGREIHRQIVLKEGLLDLSYLYASVRPSFIETSS